MFRILSLTLCWLSVLTSIAFAAPPTSVDLHSGWKFRAVAASADHPGIDQWRDAEVPGLVQMDLLRNKQIPDPFYRDNEKSLQWIGLTDWEYRTEFNVDAATLARGHVDLYFAGLDTYADVYLNDGEILKADNMRPEISRAAAPASVARTPPCFGHSPPPQSLRTKHRSQGSTVHPCVSPSKSSLESQETQRNAFCLFLEMFLRNVLKKVCSEESCSDHS